MERSYETSQQTSSQSGTTLSSLGHNFLVYLRTRTPEHWLFFAVGVIAGLIIAG